MTLYRKVLGGYRPSTADNERIAFPNNLKDLIERCWHSNPSKRPSFETIKDELSSKLSEAHLLSGRAWFARERRRSSRRSSSILLSSKFETELPSSKVETSPLSMETSCVDGDDALDVILLRKDECKAYAAAQYRREWCEQIDAFFDASQRDGVIPKKLMDKYLFRSSPRRLSSSYRRNSSEGDAASDVVLKKQGAKAFVREKYGLDWNSRLDDFFDAVEEKGAVRRASLAKMASRCARASVDHTAEGGGEAEEGT